MGWLNKIFKGSSSHKISQGQYHGKYGDDGYWTEQSSHLDGLSDIENEDLDRAIAISLSEEEQKKADVADDTSHLEDDEQLARALEENNGSHLEEEDEQLARALQESLNTKSPPRENGHLYEPITFPFSTGFRICAGCNTEIGHGRFLNCMGGVWHPECFRCHACNLPISDYEIPTNESGLIEYRAHPFWLQKYCPSHEVDRTPRCCSCERMEVSSLSPDFQPRDARYVTLDDGRKLCLECLDSAIMDTSECQPLYLDIQEFYEGLNMKVEQQIPLLLVERQALNEALEGEKNGHHHMPETRGLCLSEEQTVSSILRKPRIGAGNRIVEMFTEPYKLTRRCEVTAILILFGLPRLLTGSILAHEMMHAWLRLKGYRSLSQEVEEGICQVLAHMWLDSEILSGSGSNVASTSAPSSSSSSSTSKKGMRSQFERKLGDFFKHQIESDTSSAYGDGFRAGNKAVLQYGLRRTLDHIKLTGSFPY
ncbi:protein DA1-related 1-like protein [Cinnamomum micranthum f. kanehirae]|uniref:Protein DA1-related 1-like protein n=1 Tax=Cinnamomum micranthum f. kanehirae TaxID=337451 RepID=A0A443PY38_9MAGN|nr:protein DA1-related 1-like protein [Cinnamomum micranthum f. kanehirae]